MFVELAALDAWRLCRGSKQKGPHSVNVPNEARSRRLVNAQLRARQTMQNARSPSHEGQHGLHIAGRSSGSGFTLEKAPSHDTIVAVVLPPSLVIPYSGGAAPELHRVPFSDHATRNHQRVMSPASNERNVDRHCPFAQPALRRGSLARGVRLSDHAP